jgi:23S rRNA (adenine2030-N6)-methyltransferase
MNYRHAYHAGNFADVFKHILLTRILLYLLHKESPLFYLETHAGAGLYDLTSDSAVQTMEWRNGIGRLLENPLPPPTILDLLQPYLDIVGSPYRRDRPALYPGSPILAQRLLRKQDRLTLCELHPVDVVALKRNLGRDARIKTIEIDGYTALKAYVPPKERRGVVLIDPPFEVAGEFGRLRDQLRVAYRKWSTGVYGVWYPLTDRQQASVLVEGLVNGEIEKILDLRLAIGRSGETSPAFVGCGMIVINPPFVLHQEAKILLPFLCDRLGQGKGQGWSIDWLSP